MRYVHENRETAQKTADKLRKRVLEEYTWDICAKRVAERLIELT